MTTTEWKTPPARPVTLTPVRCKWCGKPQFDVQAPTVVRFRCNDRGCRMEQQIDIPAR